MTKAKSNVFKTLSFLMLLLVAVVFLSGCGPKEKKLNHQLSDETKNLAISEIKDYKEVIDAAIAQDNETLSLVVIVKYNTTKEKAKELGEDFVRMVKTLSDDDNPEKEVGPGKYNYLITVAFPNQQTIVQGAKAMISSHIGW